MQCVASLEPANPCHLLLPCAHCAASETGAFAAPPSQGAQAAGKDASAKYVAAVTGNEEAAGPRMQIVDGR